MAQPLAWAGLGYAVPSADRVGVCSFTPEHFYYSCFLALNTSSLKCESDRCESSTSCARAPLSPSVVSTPFVSFTLLLLKHFISSLDDVSEPLFSKPAGLEEFLAAGCRPGNIHHTHISSGHSQILLLFSQCYAVAFHLL